MKVLVGKADVNEEARLAVQTGAKSIGVQSIGVECTNYIRSLLAAGWTNASQNLVVGGACFSLQGFRDIGQSLSGVRVIAAENNFLGDLAMPVSSERSKFLNAQALIVDRELLATAPQYRETGFGRAGFNLAIRFWQAANRAAALGNLSGDGVFSVLDSMTNHVAFGGGRLSCGDAPSPYGSNCDHYLRAFQWDGENLKVESSLFSPLGLLAGTPIVDSSNPPDSRLLNP